MEFDEFQRMLLEEINIKDEPNADDGVDDDSRTPNNHPLDWKLDLNAEILPSERKFQRDSDDNIRKKEERMRKSEMSSSNSNQDTRVESCAIYRKVKLLVDVLKNCKRKEKCGICEKYIQQLQEHILLTHGNRDDMSGSVPAPLLDRINMSVKQEGIKLDIPPDYELPNSCFNMRDTDIDSSEIGTEPFYQVSKKKNIRKKSKKNRNEKRTGKSKPYKCEICGKGFLTFFDSTEHKKTHNIEKSNMRDVDVMPNYLQTTSYLNKYRLSAESRKQKLKHSDSRMIIPSVVPLNNNRLTRNGKNVYKCAKEKLKHPEQKLHVCDMCGKSFPRHYTLTRHKLAHTGEKPHKCIECGMCFARLFILNRHKLTHTGENPHKCDLCGRSFARLSKLTRHKLIHTGEKSHQCDVCGKGFGQRSDLIRHKIIHTGVKPHKCDVCGKGFGQHSDLIRHKIIHTGEKPRKCDVCGKGFVQLSGLIRHKIIHTGEKPHKCDVCGKCFAHAYHLTRHKIIHTGEKPQHS